MRVAGRNEELGRIIRGATLRLQVPHAPRAPMVPLVLRWLEAFGVPGHATVRCALGQVVSALLLAQSLRPTALMQALLSPTPVPARQRSKRLARALGRRWLTPACLTPALVRGALALVAPDPPPGRRPG